ncbi:glycosyltransferase family 1 protein [Xylariaceae sp. FL1272]|nr:glycosyltransferase family 1 protein [Xylariaceae sp. FL1272]
MLSQPDSEPSAAGRTPAQRPIILVVSHGLSGHLAPMLRIAAALHNLSWDLYFLGPTAHAERITATGATFFPLRGTADLDDKAYYESPPVPGYNSLHWSERVMMDLRYQCFEPLPAQWHCVKCALGMIRGKEPERQVVVLAEAFFFGIMPLHYGASLDEYEELSTSPELVRPKSLCISVTVPAIRSVDLPPSGYPVPYDPSPEGQARNAALWRGWTRRAKDLTALLETKMREAGATESVDEVFLSGANYKCHAKILQLGVPGFEYPRSDWPDGFKFAGLVQGRPLPKKETINPVEDRKGEQLDGVSRNPLETNSQPTKTPPASKPPFPWWPILESNSQLAIRSPARKKIIVVSQGTVEINPQDLIIPTIQAFSNHPDIQVIVILGWKGATLSLSPSTINQESSNDDMPTNIHIADYLSYDAVLPHADVWVHNAGFGAINHGIANGIPMVVAGEGMDKTENARRVAWSGIGIDLETANPSSYQVREAIEHVLGDDKFAQRVQVLTRKSEALDCFQVIHDELMSLSTM